MKGRVIIAGAGPGDPDLITRKALRYIQQADVVVTDRLVSPVLIAEARKDALIFFVGKQGRNDKSVAQEDINDLLVTLADKHALIVRLKGGDVTIFANLLDELETLVFHQIPYEIVPGITAAAGAAACTGIPLTARGHASAVRFLTAYDPCRIEESEWQNLAATSDTLVFYMTSGSLGIVVDKLLDRSISADTWLAVVEQATTPEQKVTLFNIYEYEQHAAKAKWSSPSIIIMGSVAKLYQNFAWLANAGANEYFKPVTPVTGQLISTLEQ